MTTFDLTIQGMSCGHCVKAVQEALRRVKGVERVHIMQGGREVRVFVGERESKVENKPAIGWEAIYGGGNGGNGGAKKGVTDNEMPDIAREIATQIEEQLTYPGQIRVTVIRETRAIGVAR